MSIWPFNKRVQRDVDQLIFDCAEHHRPSDQKELIARLMHTVLFAPVASGAPNLPEGTRHVVREDDAIRLFTVPVGNLNCLAFYTSRAAAPRDCSSISMSGKAAMRMVLQVKADGISTQNSRNSYLALDAQSIRHALHFA